MAEHICDATINPCVCGHWWEYQSTYRLAAARMSVQKGFNGWGPLDTCAACGTTVVAQHEDGVERLHCPNESCAIDRCYRPLPTKSGDEKLLRFLYENNHATPFEMGGMIIEVQAPIFVFREWHRHRTQSYNEASARYAPLPAIDYMPTLDRMMIGVNPTTNKQAGTVSGAEMLTEEAANRWLQDLYAIQIEAEEHYQKGLKLGVPKELARLSMTVGRYSKMRASANLRNWLGFLVLRMDSKAQWEIRQYANAVGEMIKQIFPRTYSLFMEKAK